ncbi:MAG: hypothetical protein ACOC07_08400 [Coleofasciculus sp.]
MFFPGIGQNGNGAIALNSIDIIGGQRINSLQLQIYDSSVTSVQQSVAYLKR